MKIFYLVQDNNTPSWGIGVIYHHVKCLFEAGFDAFILHEQEGYKLPWLELDVPLKYISNFKSDNISGDDVLVVPEVLVNNSFIESWKGKKILFIQGFAYVFKHLPTNKTHKDLGFSKCIIIMPHQINLVEKHVGLPYVLIPPMIADYFLENSIPEKKKKQILIYPKFSQIDFTIITNLILRKIGKNKVKKALGFDWRLMVLQNLDHKGVARTMRDANIFISVNLFEALNTSVVEAMASGCIIFCYEGFGPRDFLRNGENAFVFPNNEAYMLIEKLYDVLDNYDAYSEQLKQMRLNARKTAENYSYLNLKNSLLENINRII